MATVVGKHVQGSLGRAIGYRAEYEVTGNTIHYKASFTGSGTASASEGEFDFDPTKIGASAAVDAFLQNHIEKSDFDVAP